MGEKPNSQDVTLPLVFQLARNSGREECCTAKNCGDDLCVKDGTNRYVL